MSSVSLNGIEIKGIHWKTWTYDNQTRLSFDIKSKVWHMEPYPEPMLKNELAKIIQKSSKKRLRQNYQCPYLL